VKKPSGIEVVWDVGVFRSDSNGNVDNTEAATALTYISKINDLNEAGTYKLHAYVEWLDGASKHHGQVTTFKVYKKFEL
jgi:hypothetical protein